MSNIDKAKEVFNNTSVVTRNVVIGAIVVFVVFTILYIAK